MSDEVGAAILGQQLGGGELRPVAPNATMEEQISVINDVILHLNALLKTQIFQDQMTKRMLSGYQENGWGTGKHFGMKVSIEGVDVTKATDDQLLFKMDFATWYWYDPLTHKNHTQVGILPDGSGGVDVAKAGSNVADAYP
jgi:hypothetical protein